MDFFGTHDARMDDKNRVAIPAKLRHAFGEGQAYLMANSDGCIFIYTEASFENFRAEVKQAPRTTSEGRARWREFFGNMEPVKPDAQGRIVIPTRLLPVLGMTEPGDMKFLGMDEWIELWSAEGYERRPVRGE
jgi:MraZ protein